MYVYHNGNEYTGAIQWINGLPYDAAGQELTYTETASSGLEAGNESGVMQAQALADWEGEEQSWHNILLGLDKTDLQSTLRDEGTGFFKSLQIAFSNLGSDFVVETDHIVQAAESPIDTGEAILKVVAGYLQKALPSDWDKYLPDDWQENKMYANAINAYYADKYGAGGKIDKEKLLDSIAEQPVSVMLDFYAIKAIATAIASKAARTAEVTGKGTDIAIAEELATYERTVIDKGGLVWHEGMGAWVNSPMIPKLAQQVDDVALTARTIPPRTVPIGADRSGMLTLQHQNKAKIGDAVMYEYPIMNAAQRAAHEARTVARENARKPAVLADDVASAEVVEEAALSAVNAARLAEATRYGLARKEAGDMYPKPVTAVNLTGTRVADGTLKVATQADEAKLLRDEEITHLSNQIVRLDSIAANEGLSAAQLVEYQRYWDTLEEASKKVETKLPVATVGKSNLATQADEVKLARMEKQLADDAKLAAATQSELFSTANAATYENYSHLINSVRLANEAKITNLKKTGMLDASAISRLDNEFYDTPILRNDKVEYPKVASIPAISRLDNESFDIPILRNDIVEYPKVASIPKIKSATESRLGTRQPTYTTPSMLRATSQVLQRISAANQGREDMELPAYDNESFDIPILGNDIVTNPDYIEPKEEAPAIPPPPERRAGWMQGNTYADNDGNWWSADFDHEHWNTPAGVNEAISIWGRPMGTRHSWETPAAIKSQYTYRQKPDFSWMNEYD